MQSLKMRRLSIDVDDTMLARAEASAAARRKTIQELVAEYLQLIGKDIVTVELPHAACRPFIHMYRHGGRDAITGYISKGGWAAFERPMPNYFFACAKMHPGIIIDGGANTGFYSLLAASASANNRTLAFEPDPVVHKLLRANIDANSLEAYIVAEAVALSGVEGVAPLYVPTQDHGVVETSSSLESRFKPRYHETLDVRTVTVDGLTALTNPSEQRVSVIKIDVAGHECAVLAGAVRTVARHRPVIFVEILERAETGFLSHFIGSHGYIDVPLRSDGPLIAHGTVAFVPAAWNHALVPGELLTRFLTASRAAV
jgi:FkbM family methyltransferase